MIQIKTVTQTIQVNVVEINGKEYTLDYLCKLAHECLDDDNDRHFTFFGYDNFIDDNETRDNFIKEKMVIQIYNGKYDYFQITDKGFEFFEELIK